MRKLVDEVVMYRVNGGEWRDTSIWHHAKYIEETQCEPYLTKKMTFAETVKAIEVGLVRNASTDVTAFRKRPYITLPSTSGCTLNYTYFEKEIESVEVKIVYEPYSTTMKHLAEVLSADEFCAYLRDRGITTIYPVK